MHFHLSQEIKNSTAPNLTCYLQMALNGYYPLFHQEWIHHYAATSHAPKITLYKARRNLKERFEYLEKFKRIEKQQIFLESLPHQERNLFIQSFFKVVEHLAIEKQHHHHGLH